MNIQFYIDDSFPLSNLDCKEILQEVTTIFSELAKGNDINVYFRFKPDVKQALDKLHLWEEKQHELSK